MKQAIFLLFALIFFGAASCKKESNYGGLNGTWQLVEIYDKSDNKTFIPPASSGNDPALTLSSGKFSGHTLVNSISGGTYSVKPGDLVIFNSYTATSVSEDMWGSMLFTMLNACSLSSSAPCGASTYIVTAGTLEIDTPLRYTFKFVRS